MICLASAARPLARKGGCPVSISYSRMPTDHQSTAFPCPLPATTSGAMYSTVPMNELVRRSSVSSRPPLAKPKSVTLTWPRASSKTFSGFRSRWTNPSEWRCATASTISAAYSLASSSPKTPCLYSWKKRWPPATKSSTRYSLSLV